MKKYTKTKNIPITYNYKAKLCIKRLQNNIFDTYL